MKGLSDQLWEQYEQRKTARERAGKTFPSLQTIEQQFLDWLLNKFWVENYNDGDI